MWKKIINKTKRNGFDYFQIIMFLTSLHFLTKSTFIVGLIVWLGLVCLSLGLLNKNKFIKIITHV